MSNNKWWENEEHLLKKTRVYLMFPPQTLGNCELLQYQYNINSISIQYQFNIICYLLIQWNSLPKDQYNITNEIQEEKFQWPHVHDKQNLQVKMSNTHASCQINHKLWTVSGAEQLKAALLP